MQKRLKILGSVEDHISVCICTYKRPRLLKNLLEMLQNQITNDLFVYSVVVVDNDFNQSAKAIVESFKDNSKIQIEYYVEPIQNIALARNKAVVNSKGDFVAFIDDDEFPIDDWLLNLYQTLNKYGVEGVLGPIKPYFDTSPPKWIIKGRVFERPAHETGTILNWNNTRTGNVLLKRNLFGKQKDLFDPAYGSGGEDRDFFRRMIKIGYKFIWCGEATVLELIPPVRFKRTFMLKRALLRGKVSLISSSPIDILKSVLAIAQYTLMLPFLLFIGHHHFMKYLIKDFDHLGRVLAFFGINAVKENYVLE
jgi:glycosyltransferase involved in cell wall biosynthesis